MSVLSLEVTDSLFLFLPLLKLEILNKDSNSCRNWDFQTNTKYWKTDNTASSLNLCICSTFKANQHVKENVQIIPSHKCQVPVSSNYNFTEICLLTSWGKTYNLFLLIHGTNDSSYCSNG